MEDMMSTWQVRCRTHRDSLNDLNNLSQLFAWIGGTAALLQVVHLTAGADCLEGSYS